MMNYFWHDLRFGARMLLKKPGFTFIIDPPTFIAVTLFIGDGSVAGLLGSDPGGRRRVDQMKVLKRD
jgi:hypothetical protein